MLLRSTPPRRGDRHPPVAPPRRAPSSTALLALGAVLAVFGGTVLAASARADPPVSAGTIPTTDVGHGTATANPGPGPIAVAVPSLDIDAAITPVHPTRSGELGVPSSYTAAGWWGGSPGIDTTTPAILVGHVDDHHGPAVFYRISRLHPGADITITTTNREHLHYLIDAVRQYTDAHFPSELVYATTTRPTLRLITCGGYSWIRRHYQDNIVVFAHLSGLTPR